MTHGPDLNQLVALFQPNDYLADHEPVSAEQVPEPYRSLLCHEHHMTVTVEEHHGELVDVEVLEHRLDGESYSRKILLRTQGSKKIVMFGLVTVHLNYCNPQVRAEILSRTTPLGRILINHDVLRRIEPTGYLRLTPGVGLMHWFGLQNPTPCYGRLAYIHCDGQPAIELLEIVLPEAAS